LNFYDLEDLKNHKNDIQKNTYYYFTKPNFKSIDAFAIVDDNVLTFQITIAKSHPVLASGLLDFYNCIQDDIYPNEKLAYHLIFIGRENENGKTTIKNQMIRNDIDKNITDERQTLIISEFQRNQWSMIYNLSTTLELLLNKAINK
jgi:hypothetical protein